MACKYLIKTTRVVPGGVEVGDSPYPKNMIAFACELDRNPGEYSWPSKCSETDHDGPCWYWIEENGDKIDKMFSSG